MSLAADTTIPGRVWWGQESVVILRSDDHGRTWRFMVGESDTYGGAIETILPSSSGRILAAGTSATFRSLFMWSDDGGETWRGNRPTGFVERTVRALLEHPQRPHTLWAATRAGILRSDDWGRKGSWEPVVIGGDFDHRRKWFMDLAFQELRRYALSWEQETLEGGEIAESLGLYWAPLNTEEWRQIAVPREAAPGTVLLPLNTGGLLTGTTDGVWSFLSR